MNLLEEIQSSFKAKDYIDSLAKFKCEGTETIKIQMDGYLMNDYANGILDEKIMSGEYYIELVFDETKGEEYSNDDTDKAYYMYVTKLY